MDDINPDWTALVADRRINDAMEAGEFDDVAGKGEPLSDEVLSQSAFDRVTARMLKKAGALPAWIQSEKDIVHEAALVAPRRERGLTHIRAMNTAEGREQGAHRLRAEHRERLDLLNTLILKYCFAAPQGLQRPFRSYNIKAEMAQLDADIAQALNAPFAAAPSPAPRFGRRR